MSLAPAGLSRVLSRIDEIRGTTRRASGFSTVLVEAVSKTNESPVSGPEALEHAEASPPQVAPASAARWSGSIRRAADVAGVDPRLLTAVVWTESTFVPDAVSSAGAIGLTQLMPETANALGVDPFDPEQNLTGGARFLREMIDRFGRVDLALAAYNAGPTRLQTELEANPGSDDVPIAQDYVTTVLNRYRSLEGDT